VINVYQNVGVARDACAGLEVSYRNDIGVVGGVDGDGERISARAFYSYLWKTGSTLRTTH